MTNETITALEARLQAALAHITSRCTTARGVLRRSHWDLMEAQRTVGAALEPSVPAGTLQWLASPRAGEHPARYVARAYGLADSRSAWAGGLRAEATQ